MAILDVLAENRRVVAGAVAVGAVGTLAYALLAGPARGTNPFLTDTRRAPGTLEMDQKKRDRVLKQGYTKDKVPEDLDAIVIGSGIGGLTAAALLSRAGKRVLVLEQHDQIGGCCHTFHDKGYEFDVGIHYIGEMRNNTILKYLLDQISDGQIQWTPLNDEYDRIALADPNKPDGFRYYSVLAGKGKYEANLRKQFPDAKDQESITKYMAMLQAIRPAIRGFILLKFLPLWLARFLSSTGLVHLFTDYFKMSAKTLEEVLDELTDNEELKAVISYCFGDYGTLPCDTAFTMHAALVAHFMYGVAYPRGGSSEIAFNIIPVIERSGGRCLVRANVSEIVLDESGTRAVGVRVEKDGNVIRAPTVVSAAGIINTFKTLLPDKARAQVPAVGQTLDHVRSGFGCMTAYIGLEGTPEELGIQGTNVWAFKGGCELNEICKKFLESNLQEIMNTRQIPMMFISFPSSKDPTWESRFPGKTTCEIVTLARWEWFEEWKDERVKKRGVEYKSIKKELLDILWEQALGIFPQLEGKADYMDIGSPLSNNYYIASPKGEIYGADHNIGRFTPRATADLRPETPIKGLYLAGQDVFNCGFAGAMFGGMLGAAAALNRNLVVDIVMAKGKFPPRKF